MVKSTRKLELNRETLRVLAELELARIPAAGAALVAETAGPAQGCVLQALVLPQK